jgi:hypothetical protein
MCKENTPTERNDHLYEQLQDLFRSIEMLKRAEEKERRKLRKLGRGIRRLEMMVSQPGRIAPRIRRNNMQHRSRASMEDGEKANH